MVEEYTRQRLQRRMEQEEQTYDELIKQLLDETAEVITLEEVIETALEQCNDAVALVVDHPGGIKDSVHFLIWIYAGEVNGFSGQKSLFNGKQMLGIERDGEDEVVEFEVAARCDGPAVLDAQERTTVYMSDNVIGTNPIGLEAGIQHFKEKLANPQEWKANQRADSFGTYNEEGE